MNVKEAVPKVIGFTDDMLDECRGKRPNSNKLKTTELSANLTHASFHFFLSICILS
jgi:hypothetical protein